MKNWILTKTANEIDIMSKGLFPKYTMLMKGLFRELKREGKDDTTHHEPLDEVSLGKIYEAITNVTDLFKSRGTPAFMDHLAKVPAEFRNNFNKWLQMCTQPFRCEARL